MKRGGEVDRRGGGGGDDSEGVKRLLEVDEKSGCEGDRKDWGTGEVEIGSSGDDKGRGESKRGGSVEFFGKVSGTSVCVASPFS